MKPKTLAEYEKRLTRINAAFGHKKLSELNTGVLNQFYANLQEQGMNAHSHKAKAKNLKETLKARKLTAVELSKVAGLSVRTIYAAWRGNTIEKESADKIAKALNLKFKDCFTTTGGTATCRPQPCGLFTG